MLELLRRYLRLMRTHDFSYQYTEYNKLYERERQKRVVIIMIKGCLLLTKRGRWFITRAEKKYGYV